MTSDSICWECAKCTGACPWSQYGVPVKGWSAAAVKLKITQNRIENSFIIKKCPLFELDKHTKQEREEQEQKHKKHITIKSIYIEFSQFLNISFGAVKNADMRGSLEQRLKDNKAPLELMEKYNKYLNRSKNNER